jgi:phosphopantetheinyl transferase
MPLFYQQNINPTTKLAVWHIQEPEEFFYEKAILQRNIVHPHKRLQHLAGRYLLKFLYPDFPNDEMMVADTRKPYLPNEQFHFSISHCGDYAAAIVSIDRRVGIDIELKTERVENIKHKFLHADELTAVENSADNNISLLTLLWTAKEAMYKWWGFGEVDFSDVLRLKVPEMKSEGRLIGSFEKELIEIPLELHYKEWENVVLCFLNTEKDAFKMVD